MNLKFKYHSDSCLLEAYRSYTLAQNNSLSDVILITSTAQDAERYNYCLEFICYNSKSIPKAQYISPILKYKDGISFAVPNNLTEFRGHVDMQLTGYDPDDNSIVFKSISKNCKAFDVEGSLCVLEKDLNDTPNVFTEVLKKIEDLHNIHEDIIDEAMERYGKHMLAMIEKYKWYKVKFFDYGKLIEERWALGGSKLTSPQYILPDNCEIVGGWYNPATGAMWDMDNDTVQSDMELYLNYKTDTLEIKDGAVASFGEQTRIDIYIPEYYEGVKVESVNVGPTYPANIHMGYNMSNIDILFTNKYVTGMYFPENHPEIISQEGFLYVRSDLKILAFAPKLFYHDALIVMQGCRAINSYAVNSNEMLRRLILPNTLEMILEYSIVDTGIEELILPPNVMRIDDRAVFCNPNLKRVILEGDASSIINDNTFVNIDVNNGGFSRPKLCVYPQYYDNYKARGLAYEIEVLGQEYFDGKYAPKGE